MSSRVGIRWIWILAMWVLLGTLWPAGSASGAEHVLRVSDGVSDPNEPFYLTERHYFTWGVRGFSPGPTEELEDAILLVAVPQPAGVPAGAVRLRVQLLDTAENPENGVRDEAMPPRGRLRRYDWGTVDPSQRARGPELSWTTRVGLLNRILSGSGETGRPVLVRYSLREHGLLEYFRTFWSHGWNFGLVMDADGELGQPLVRFVVVTREIAPAPLGSWGRPVPRIGERFVRVPEGGSTWVMLAAFLCGAALWWSVRGRRPTR
ncbi:hypothetical protein [Limisphaera sp. 4302-co]|uniref:hypothetical protein n=1 Tax=Limisphaera sp. 4302-co TaxID=3400417 RepID=UPI003C1E0005